MARFSAVVKPSVTNSTGLQVLGGMLVVPEDGYYAFPGTAKFKWLDKGHVLVTKQRWLLRWDGVGVPFGQV